MPGLGRRRRLWIPGASLGLLLLALCPGARAEATEYQVKAVFLYNFAAFVEWPQGSFPAPDTPLVIGVLGNDPFGSYIDEAVSGEKVNGRPLAIRRFSRVEDVSGCQILFISRSEESRLGNVLSALKGKSILTVSDINNFSHAGGMIDFFTERNKVRLKINPKVAKESRLTISSKLLRPALIVTTTEPAT